MQLLSPAETRYFGEIVFDDQTLIILQYILCHRSSSLMSSFETVSWENYINTIKSRRNNQFMTHDKDAMAQKRHRNSFIDHINANIYIKKRWGYGSILVLWWNFRLVFHSGLLLLLSLQKEHKFSCNKISFSFTVCCLHVCECVSLSQSGLYSFSNILSCIFFFILCHFAFSILAHVVVTSLIVYCCALHFVYLLHWIEFHEKCVWACKELNSVLKWNGLHQSLRFPFDSI